MALRTIVNSTEDVLHKKCKEVPEVTDKTRELLDDLVETMRAANGVGLAAPQVGILRRICVIEVPEDPKTYELINPEIIFKEGDQYGEEGCLSVPGLCGDVHRPKKVKVKCLDRNGKEVIYEGKDLLARAFCHEIDHLDGHIYTEIADNIRDVNYSEEE
ncbi:MAG: peptide deformylase [Clostridia bacterium]|nr:peptide deformylase [Clostridia bacterium]